MIIEHDIDTYRGCVMRNRADSDLRIAGRYLARIILCPAAQNPAKLPKKSKKAKLTLEKE